MTDFTYHTFGASEDFTERHVYRFRSVFNYTTLVCKRKGVVYVLGFGDGRRISLSCDEWDALYAPERRVTG